MGVAKFGATLLPAITHSLRSVRATPHPAFNFFRLPQIRIDPRLPAAAGPAIGRERVRVERSFTVDSTAI
jgi:hypothetical protein